MKTRHLLHVRHPVYRARICIDMSAKKKKKRAVLRKMTYKDKASYACSPSRISSMLK